MAIKVNDIVSILGLNKKTFSQLVTIILEYGDLVQKMRNIDFFYSIPLAKTLLALIKISIGGLNKGAAAFLIS